MSENYYAITKFCSNNPYETDYPTLNQPFNKKTAPGTMNIFDSVPADQRQWLVFTNVIEFLKVWDYTTLVRGLNYVQDRYDECIWIVDHTCHQLEYIKQHVNSKVTVMDRQTMLIWYMSCCLGSEQKFLDKPAKSDKFLFYAGKFDKYHRLAVLDSLIHSNLLNVDNCVWSCKIPKPHSEAEQDFINIINSTNSNSFVLKDINSFKMFERNIDHDLNQYHNQIGGLHHIGVPFEIDHYRNVGFNLVSETRCVGSEDWEINGFRNWISEKTLRPLLAGIPFLLYGSTNTYEYLESLGINTFKEFHGFNTDSYNKMEQLPDLIYNQLPTAIRKMQIVCNSETGHSEMCEITKNNKKIIENIFRKEINELLHINCKITSPEDVSTYGQNHWEQFVSDNPKFQNQNLFQIFSQIYGPAPMVAPTDVYDLNKLTNEKLMLY